MCNFFITFVWFCIHVLWLRKILNLKYKQFPPIVYLCLLFTNVRRAVFNSKYFPPQLFILSILSPRTLLSLNVVVLLFLLIFFCLLTCYVFICEIIYRLIHTIKDQSVYSLVYSSDPFLAVFSLTWVIWRYQHPRHQRWNVK